MPPLLNHLGIPATRSMQRFCNQLANYLLGQTLLLKFSADAERQTQADHELRGADARVKQARQRLSTFATSSTRFFLMNRSDDSCSTNNEDKEKIISLKNL